MEATVVYWGYIELGAGPPLVDGSQNKIQVNEAGSKTFS